MKFLLNYLNMEMDLEASLELKPQVKHIFPLCCLPDWEMGRYMNILFKPGNHTVFPKRYHYFQMQDIKNIFTFELLF